jgi:hypothetical protein
MVCVIEVALFAWGLYGLITGKLQISRNKLVVGTPARLLAVLALLPLPIALGVGLLIGMDAGMRGGEIPREKQLTLTLIEAGVAVTVLLIVIVAILVMGTPPERKKPVVDDFDDDLAMRREPMDAPRPPLPDGPADERIRDRPA